MQHTFTPNKLGKFIIITAIIVIAVMLFSNKKNLKKITVNTMNFIKEKTWDVLTDRHIAKLHPAIRDKAKSFIIKVEKELGIRLRIYSSLRTWEEQSQLYAKGRSVPGRIVTRAKAGQSFHNYGLAIDVVEIRNGKAIWENPNWQKIAAIGKSLGFTWGGDWKFTDKPHFQMNFGKRTHELARLYKQGKRRGNYVILT